MEFHKNSCNIDIECICKTMQTGAHNMHLRLKVSLILIATTLQNHTYVGDNTNSAKMFLLTGNKNVTIHSFCPSYMY